jgi:pyrroline-5-carboxylate reductase
MSPTAPSGASGASPSFELVVVGGGNMGAALVGGLVAAGTLDVSRLAIVEVVAERREALRTQFPGVTVTDATPPCSAAVIAVKPHDVAAASQAAVAAGATRILSIAAGVSTAAIDAACGDGIAVVRAMPNTPALVGQGAAAISPGAGAGADDLAWAESVLGAVGTVVRVAEPQLDAVTGLAGSGPAYVFLIAEALAEAGVLNGLDRPTSEALVTQLLVGSAALLAERGDPARLRAMVTSPGGTTAAGLRVLEDHGVRAALLHAVTSATERSRELGAER